MSASWVYRVGLSQDEVSEKVLQKFGLKYELVEVEAALRAHINETMGKPYKFYTSMREDAPNFFSCSSLISYLYIFAGVWMPSVVIDKFFFAKPIAEEELQFGDLIFSTSEPDGSRPQRSVSFEYMPGQLSADKPVTHMVMYLGNGEVLNASDTRCEVIVEKLVESPFYNNIVGFGRVADMKDKRFVIEIPDDRPDLRNKENLMKYLTI